MVFSGPPGLGKTRLASALAADLEVDVQSQMGGTLTAQSLSEFIASTNCVGYDLDTGQLVDQAKARPSIRVFEECEKMKPDLLRDLHFALEPDASGVRKFQAKIKGETSRQWIWVPNFTAIFLTNYLGEFRKRGDAVISRCSIRYTFEPYNDEEMIKVIRWHCISTDVQIEPEAIGILAVRSHGIPRFAISVIERCSNKLIALRGRGEYEGEKITATILEDTMDSLGLDKLGLDNYSRNYLKHLSQSEGKISLKTLSSQLNLDPETLEVDVEPLLLRAGLIEIGQGGRRITDKGLGHVGRGNGVSIRSRIIKE